MADMTSPSHRPPAGDASALTRDNLLLSQALQALHRGDLELAQAMIQAAQGTALSLGDVFRHYQSELETQAMDLRESQQRAESSLDWFAQLFRGLPMPALLVDGRGMVSDANAVAAEELSLRATRGERPAPDLAPPTQSQPAHPGYQPHLPFLPLRRLMADAGSESRLQDVLPRATTSDVLTVDNLHLRTPDGRVLLADLRITRMPARSGEHVPPGLLVVVHDRTAQVAAAEALEATARARAERELDLARAAGRAKTQLLSRVSHELRTPLNAVIGFSDLLLSGPETLSPQASFKIGHIQNAGRQLLSLVDDVLQINLAETGQLQHAPTRLDLGALVRDVAEQLQPLAQAGAVRLVTALPQTAAAPVLAWADPKRVREILNNLVSNGIKYNRPQGEVCLQLRSDGSRVVVEVSDTGQGMSADQLDHLFEPFNRLGAEKTRVPGYGLGLNISRGLAQAMGGGLTASSQPGGGSRFFLQLPALAAPTGAATVAGA